MMAISPSPYVYRLDALRKKTKTDDLPDGHIILGDSDHRRGVVFVFCVHLPGKVNEVMSLPFSFFLSFFFVFFSMDRM